MNKNVACSRTVRRFFSRVLVQRLPQEEGTTPRFATFVIASTQFVTISRTPKHFVQPRLNLVRQRHRGDAAQHQGRPAGHRRRGRHAEERELGGVGEEQLGAADHVDDGGGGQAGGGDEEERRHDAGHGAAARQQPVQELHGARI